MKGALHARYMNASRASSAPVEFGGDFSRRRIAELLDDRFQLAGLNGRRRAAAFGRWRQASELTFQPDPSLDAGDANVEPLTDVSVAAFAGKVRAYYSLTQLNRVRFRHAATRSETNLGGKNLDQPR